ncbi:unnamed protein product [Calypogeia fissa]
MDDDFKKDAKKQGFNIWDKVQQRMITACPKFSKTSEACKKKWKTIYRQYNNDKHLLQISGEGRKIAWKFFVEIDQGFHKRANVRKFCHGDVACTPNPCPLDVSEDAPEE